MANLTEDELEVMERKARDDETERCAQLCTMRGDISRASAAKVRREGSISFYVRSIWPPFAKRLVTHTNPKWESAARDLDEVGRAFDVVADCIRKGYDPRKLDPNEVVKINPWQPCAECSAPMDCGSWMACEKGKK
jgi:hypothetical protein